MRSVVLSPRAKADLSEIWDYTYGNWGEEQAEKYIRELWAGVEKLAADLSQSVDISDVRPGYRKVRTGSHVIFFRLINGEAIDIVRILHQRMDFNRHL